MTPRQRKSFISFDLSPTAQKFSSWASLQVNCEVNLLLLPGYPQLDLYITRESGCQRGMYCIMVFVGQGRCIRSLICDRKVHIIFWR